MKIIFLGLVFISNICFGQVEDAWLFFDDKPSSGVYLNDPLLMLSQRAIDRRLAHGIIVDMFDVPVEFSYVRAVSNSAGISVLAKSKWLNALYIRGDKTDLENLNSLKYVSSIQFMDSSLRNVLLNKRLDNFEEKIIEVDQLNYGATKNQIEMVEIDYLHDLGFTGNGMQIAVIDAGYKGVDTFSAFSNLHDGDLNNGEVLGGYDFVNRSDKFYSDTGNTHGLSVLSTISGFLDTEFVGSAPDAQFYLFISEDVASESPLEEILWLEAAEKSDSLGVDIINTSLGYTTFDDPRYNYSYADMDGETTFISRGAELACSRGMFLVNSAGNSGADSWKYIGAPADAPSVLSVGSVNENKEISYFSSFGPTSDNRVKPEIVAQGQNTYVINEFGNVAISNGTSFSSPLIAGTVACLWQAFPNTSAADIKALIIESSDLYNASTTQSGYGVPSFKSIYELLSKNEKNENNIQIYPNPVVDNLIVKNESFSGSFEVRIYDLLGKVILSQSFFESIVIMNLEFLSDGIYIIEIASGKQSNSIKFLKN